MLKRVQGVNAASAEPKAVFETKVQVRRPVGRKRPKKPMEKPVPAAASNAFGSASGVFSASGGQPESLQAPPAPAPAPTPASRDFADVFVRAAREGLKLEDYKKTWVISKLGYINRRKPTTTDKNWAVTLRLSFAG